MLASSETVLLNFDMRAAYNLWLQILGDAGPVMEIAPTFMDATGMSIADPAWGGGFPVLLERYTRWYGDARLAAELYPQAMAYLHHINSYAEPLPPKAGVPPTPILTTSYPGSYYGDWLAPGPLPTHISNIGNGFMHIRVTAAMLSLAQLLNHTADIPVLQTNLTALRTAYGAFFFNDTAGMFVDPFLPATAKTGLTNGPLSLQTAQALPLYLGVAAPAQQQSAATAMANDVMRAQAGHLSTGVMGLGFLARTLQDYGFPDTALTTMSAEDPPSLGYMALQDGSLWEQFDSSGSFSRNHQMFSSAVAYQHEVGRAGSGGKGGEGRVWTPRC